MKYVSVRCKSVDTVALGGPVRPPSRKTTIAPSTNNIGVGISRESLPCQRVATQEKNLTPVGTETSKVLYINGTRRYSFIPDANIWCAQTRKPTRAIPSDDIAT